MGYYQNTLAQWVGLPLYRKGEVAAYALVDVSDLELIFSVSNKWKINSQGYAYCRKGSDPNRVLVLLHRLVMGDPDAQVDHINRDRLDNRRVNLRLASAAQNMMNRQWRGDKTSGFIGVQQQGNRFIARIGIDGERKYLGSYATAEEAARAYDLVSLAQHGEFAPLNFPN